MKGELALACSISGMLRDHECKPTLLQPIQTAKLLNCENVEIKRMKGELALACSISGMLRDHECKPTLL